MAQLSRRTVLLCAAVGAVAIGGAALPLFSRSSPVIPPGPVPDLDNLPVADVPDPTDEPVEIAFCAGWDAATRTAVSPMSESAAREQDAAGAQWAAVLLVGGVARTVVEVCWSAHHAEIWNVDDKGRRYRGVAYRRWPDGRLRLFQVRSWNYDGDTPEFDGDEPTFRAGVLRDATSAITGIDIVAEQSDSTLQFRRDWPDWPEPVRPPENVAVPTVDGWPTLAGITGSRTVHSGPSVVPATFPWRPPRPLQPRNVTEMVTEGTRFRTQDGRVLTVQRVPAGRIRLPSGRLLVADPSLLDPESTPLAARVRPGTYAVDVFQVTEDQTTAMNVACRVTITDAPVTSWQLALPDGQSELNLGDGEYFGNPVDSATLSLVDHKGVAAYDADEVAAVMDSEAAYRTLSDRKTGTDLVIVPGWSDGSTPVWLGRTEDGALGAFVLDLLLSDLATAEVAR